MIVGRHLCDNTVLNHVSSDSLRSRQTNLKLGLQIDIIQAIQPDFSERRKQFSHLNPTVIGDTKNHFVSS